VEGMKRNTSDEPSQISSKPSQISSKPYKHYRKNIKVFGIVLMQEGTISKRKIFNETSHVHKGKGFAQQA
jgi:hypothetical protein